MTCGVGLRLVCMQEYIWYGLELRLVEEGAPYVEDFEILKMAYSSVFCFCFFCRYGKRPHTTTLAMCALCDISQYLTFSRRVVNSSCFWVKGYQDTIGLSRPLLQAGGGSCVLICIQYLFYG